MAMRRVCVVQDNEPEAAAIPQGDFWAFAEPQTAPCPPNPQSPDPLSGPPSGPPIPRFLRLPQHLDSKPRAVQIDQLHKPGSHNRRGEWCGEPAVWGKQPLERGLRPDHTFLVKHNTTQGTGLRTHFHLHLKHSPHYLGGRKRVIPWRFSELGMKSFSLV